MEAPLQEIFYSCKGFLAIESIETYMFILLPPSETKGFGTNVHKLKLANLSFSELTENRTRLTEQLINLSKSPQKALKVLGISQKQISEVESNSQIFLAKTAPAIEIYSGVLFDAFDYPTLSKASKQRADQSVLITSSLFGLLKLQDAIVHYRLSGDCNLPKVNGLANLWQKPTDRAISAANPDFIVDLRSGTYAKFWKPAGDFVSKTAVIKIMTRVGKGSNSKKIAISHNNKHAKGLITRDLVSMRSLPKNAEQLAEKLAALNWDCELNNPHGKPAVLEVFI